MTEGDQTSGDQLSTVAAAELREWGGRALSLIFQTIPAPIILSIIVWRSFGGPLSAFSCSLKASWLVGFWPANFNYIKQLHESPFTQDDKCWFFAVTSTVSLLYLCWFCWLVFSCVLVVKNIRHVPGTAKYILPKIGPAILVGIFGMAVAADLMFIERFGPSAGPHGLSILQPIGWSAFKVVFFIIPYSYFAAGVTANLLLLLLRYLIYRTRE